MNTMLPHIMFRPLTSLVMSFVFVTTCLAQEESKRATINSSIAEDGTDSIVLEAHGKLPEPPVFYSSKARAQVRVTADRVEQTIEVSVHVIQGNAKTVSLGINGDGEILDVSRTNAELQSWAVRQTDSARFLDLKVEDNVTDLKVTVQARSEKLQLPAEIYLLHLTHGDSVGFDSIVEIRDAEGVQQAVTSAAIFHH